MSALNSLEKFTVHFLHQESEEDYLEKISRINTIRDLKALRKQLVFLYLLGVLQLIRANKRKVDRLLKGAEAK